MLICTREVWNSFKLSQLMFCTGGGRTIHNMFLLHLAPKSVNRITCCHIQQSALTQQQQTLQYFPFTRRRSCKMVLFPICSLFSWSCCRRLRSGISNDFPVQPPRQRIEAVFSSDVVLRDYSPPPPLLATALLFSLSVHIDSFSFPSMPSNAVLRCGMHSKPTLAETARYNSLLKIK